MTAGKVQELARAKLGQLQSDIAAREEEIKRLNHDIGKRETELTKLHVVNHVDMAEIRSNQEELDRKDRQIEELRRELEEARRKIDEVVMTRKSEGTALLEIEHYKADNERLIQMLAQTKEFSSFAKLALDTPETNIRYMNPSAYDYETRKLGKCHSRKPKQGDYTLKDFTDEEEDWIPEEAFKLAHDFRNRCASTVSQPLMNQLLTDLNAVWRDREKKRIARVQNQSHREIQYLRR